VDLPSVSEHVFDDERRPCPGAADRAIPVGKLLAARALAAERTLDLDEALGLLLLIAEHEPRTFPRAAAPFVGRLGLERPLVIAEVEHAAGALVNIPPRPRRTPTSAASASATASVVRCQTRPGASAPWAETD
jgi:hypothetical protein